jgi:signal peptidase II
MNMRAAVYWSVLLVDRITKILALVYCSDQRIALNDFLTFHVIYNRGISWNIFHSESPLIFWGLTVIIMCITTALACTAYKAAKNGHTVFGYVLIIAGSVGNITDRFLYRGVVDFIELSYKMHEFPTFNCADAMIVCGVLITVYITLRD